MNDCISLRRGDLKLPAFLPDATRGTIRGLEAADLENTGTSAVMMNVFHLMQRPGSSTIQALGGLHRMYGWDRPIFTDSGGFQVYSIISGNPSLGSVTKKGMTFRPRGDTRKFQLDPEKSVRLQMSYGSDLVICLDDCVDPAAPLERHELSVDRTLGWAARSKAEYDRQLDERRVSSDDRPLMMAVVHGGPYEDLRRRCADGLLEIGFDLFGFGGWPLDKHNELVAESLEVTRRAVPDQYVIHALGIGHPENVLECFRMGYGLFDSALPTRDARSGRLYTFTSADLTDDWFDCVYVSDDRYSKVSDPIEAQCDCSTCSTYSLGWLRHLRNIEDPSYVRLATIHNLRFMARLMSRLTT